MHECQKNSNISPDRLAPLQISVVGLLVLLATLVPLFIIMEHSRQAPQTPGARLPILELRGADGTRVSIDPSKIPRLVIVFARKECPFCNEELESLRSCFQENSVKPIRTIVISLSGPPATAAWARELGPDFEVFTPGESMSLRAKRVPLLISAREGKISDVLIGIVTEDRLRAVSNDLAESSCRAGQ